jgi:NADH-quinone oxidoreductase subunit J
VSFASLPTDFPVIAGAALLAALGLWLMLPPWGTRAWRLGLALLAAGGGLGATRLPSVGDGAQCGLFWLLAGVTLAAASGTITTRNPVRSALWFALSLLGTASLFFYQGAQFLAAATVIVYAGAIVVTFLFVLMLAQPDGTAFYDRLTWGRLASLLAAGAGSGLWAAVVALVSDPSPWQEKSVPTPEALAAGTLHEQHVARLGAELFTRHLLAVEVAGTLLLVALVGAVAMVLSGRRGGVRSAVATEAREGAPNG